MIENWPPTLYIVVLQLLWLGAFYCKSQTDNVQKILKEEDSHSETFTCQDAAHIQDHALSSKQQTDLQVQANLLNQGLQDAIQ